MRTRGLYVRLRTSPDLCEQVIILSLELVLLLLPYYVRAFQQVLQVTPSINSSLTARIYKFIRQISLGEFVWFAGRIVREVFVLPKQLARTNICSSATSPVPSPCTNSSAPLLALKQYWRELKWIVEAFIPRRVSHRSQGVLLLQSRISARSTRRTVFIWIWNFASQCVPFSSVILPCFQ